MPVNVLLVRWDGGWREVTNQASIDTYGRREALLGLGALQSPQEVDRVAGQQLAIFANPRMAIAADHAPIGVGDRPFFDYNVADTIIVPNYGGGTISQRVRAISGAEDDNGEITYSPELGDLILEAQERQLQAIKKMVDGTLDGESPVATPRTLFSNENVYGTAPFPSTGFTVTSTAPIGDLPSQVLRTPPGGAGTYTLTRFWCRPQTDGPGDGVALDFVLRQFAPGGNVVAASITSLGHSFNANTVYEGVITDNTIEFGAEHGIQFDATGDMTGPVFVSAEFEGGGTAVNVDWFAA